MMMLIDAESRCEVMGFLDVRLHHKTDKNGRFLFCMQGDSYIGSEPTQIPWRGTCGA